PGELPSLRDRVEDLFHKAFWDEALEKLSDPTPAVQLPRLKRLYEDLHTALQPLLPVNHPLLIVLSSPLSPTSSPLRSAITHLRETLTCLRERCAPARDAQIETLIRHIGDLSSIAPGEDTARLVVDTIRSTLQLSEAMKDDLSQFVLGTMDEKQLRAVIIVQAQQRERELVLELWRPEQIQESWAKWLVENASSQTIGEHPARRMWVYRLVHALGLFTPVSCPLPTTPIPASAEPTEKAPVSNMLPPSFFFVCPTLLYLQNYLQALVIAASLRSLVRLPSVHAASLDSAAGGDDSGDGRTFMSRIWTLLKAEVDMEPGAGDTKLVNLADEVVRVRRQFGGADIDVEEEARLRAAVDRTLQPHDPVFRLLQGRLMQAVAERVARPLDVPSRAGGARLPERLQTGREHSGKRPRLSAEMGPIEDSAKANEPPLAVKGFEDNVLVKALQEALVKLRSCVGWTEEIWQDLI
ncbi:predicted protein, partial [Postia placenta Mad-698-R]